MKYYAFKTDSKEGVVNSWQECKQVVTGVKSRYKKFNKKEDAVKWLENGCKIILEKGIYFDGGTGSGITEARVTNEKGESILNNTNHAGNIELKGKTNNFAELFAFTKAIEIALELEVDKIFGDSKLVIDYWSKNIFNREIEKETQALIAKASALRKKYENRGGTILHISGDINPADLGYHK